MGSKQRQKDRARRAAQTTTRAVQASRWYLTVVKRDCSCNSCGRHLRARRSTMVYRHTPRWILCEACAELQAVKPRTSIRWEDQKRREIRDRAERARRRST